MSVIVRALVLTALLVLAGCSAFPSDQAGNELPPGVENGTLSDTDVLLDTHETILRETAFTRIATENTSEVLPDGSTGWRNSTHRVTAGENFSPVYGQIRFAVLDKERTQEFWANDSGQFWNIDGSYSHEESTDLPIDVSGTSTLRVLLNVSSYSVVNTTARNGRTYTTLRANGSDSYTAFDATVVVDSTGLIHEARASYAPDGETHLTKQYNSRILQTGNITAEPPGWVSAV